MRETTESIGKWAEETFGEVDSIARIVARANEEMAELIRKATSDDANWEDLVEESADVCIVLARLFWIYGTDLWEEVEKKMAVNREREWKKDGTGHGYHTKSFHAPDCAQLQKNNTCAIPRCTCGEVRR